MGRENEAVAQTARVGIRSRLYYGRSEDLDGAGAKAGTCLRSDMCSVCRHLSTVGHVFRVCCRQSEGSSVAR